MKESNFTIDYVIVGAGIIGLQVAYELLRRGVSPSEIAIFEQNIFPGEHSSSRNSGVLHAGLYYKENSLKQCFCLEGNEIWNEIARDLKIPFSRPGKYLVATSRSEIPDLEQLYEFARAKGVKGLEWVSGTEIDHCVRLEKTFISRSTGIVNVAEAIKIFSNYLTSRGVNLLLGQKVENVRKTPTGFTLEVAGEEIEANHLINCAGFFGIDLRKQLGLGELENYLVKGRYLKLNKKFNNKALVYPLPPKGLKGLGVHTSFDMEGNIKFGPDTEDVTEVNYEMKEEIIESMYPAIARIFKNIEKSDLSLDYAGIRSKIREHGNLFEDFWIKSPLPHYWEILGIESPGLTASPSIARFIVSKMLGAR